MGEREGTFRECGAPKSTLRRQEKADSGTLPQMGATKPPGDWIEMGCLYDTAHCVDGNSEVQYAYPKCSTLSRLD